MKKHSAFTLTEILVAMAIIGTITAMTIPNVISSYQKDAYITQLRKVVNDITNSADMLITEEGKQKFTQTSVFTETNGLDDFITQKFKVIKTCNKNTSGCFASVNYKTINGGNASYSCSEKSYVLANSASICMIKDTNDISVQVDTNGADGPNIGGRDMYSLKINSNGEVVPTSGTCKDSATGNGCLGDILDTNWKMDY